MRERIACIMDMSVSGRKLVSSAFFDEKKPIEQGKNGKGQVLVD